MRVASSEPRILNVNERTNWTFVRPVTDAGTTGIGEASLNGYEPLLDAHPWRSVPPGLDERMG